MEMMTRCDSPAANCPLCGNATRPRFVKDGYPIRDCPACGHRFAAFRPGADHTARVYGDDYFTGGGAGYPDYLAGAELVRAHGRRHAERVRGCVRPGRVLDVGAAAGFILAGFADRGWAGEGVEPNPGMAEYARKQLGFTVHTGTLDDYSLSAPFDLVNFVQVVAHLPDPMAAFRAADRVTKPGGCWLVETWDCGSLTARLWGTRWHEYTPPGVLHWFTPATLRRAVGQLGYRQVAGGTLVKWIGAGHAKSLLGHTLGGGVVGRAVRAAASVIPDRLALPYPADDLFWAVYRKPGAGR